MLCHSILLRSILDSMLVQDTTLGGEINEAIAHIFPSFVITQDLDLSLILVLSKGLECLKGLKCLGFGLQRDNKAKSRVVIDESDPVSVARHGEVAYIVHITMDKFQRSGCAPRGAGERIGMHLTSQAGFTDRIRSSLQVYGHTSHQILIQESLHIS